MMYASSAVVKKITFNDKLVSLINKPDVPIDEIDAILQEELGLAPAGEPLEKLTQLIHVVSIIKTKSFSNPMVAIQVFTNENTSPETRKALIDAIMMAPKQDNKIYDLICLLAQQNQLERYTQIGLVGSLQFFSSKEQYNQWYLIFDLFGLCKEIPHELIPIIAQLLITSSPAADELLALRQFLKIMGELNLLRQETIEMMLPLLCYKTGIEKLQLFLFKLQSNELLIPDVLEQVLPLLNHLDVLKIFFTIYQQELKSKSSRQETLEKLHLFCQISLPDKDSYDDVVITNTPLHQAIIHRNMPHVIQSLAIANSKFLLATSCENTGLLLACKLADKKAARLILAKMQALRCDVNQVDHHGMSALHWSKFYHFEDLSTELIQAGANENLKATNGQKAEYFSRHQFTIDDFKIIGHDMSQDNFKLKNYSLTDIAFHTDKIALNLKLASSDEVMTLYNSDESAHIRSSNRFYLFFKTFRPKLVGWLGSRRELDYQSGLSSAMVC